MKHCTSKDHSSKENSVQGLGQLTDKTELERACILYLYIVTNIRPFFLDIKTFQQKYHIQLFKLS